MFFTPLHNFLYVLFIISEFDRKHSVYGLSISFLLAFLWFPYQRLCYFQFDEVNFFFRWIFSGLRKRKTCCWIFLRLFLESKPASTQMKMFFFITNVDLKFNSENAKIFLQTFEANFNSNTGPLSHNTHFIVL